MQEHTYLMSDPLCGACAYVRFTPLIFKDCKKCLAYIKENLTMEKNPIKIILENYNNEKITFTMSSDARVETLLEINGSRVIGINIKASDEDIEIEKEDIVPPPPDGMEFGY